MIDHYATFPHKLCEVEIQSALGVYSLIKEDGKTNVFLNYHPIEVLTVESVDRSIVRDAIKAAFPKSWN